MARLALAFAIGALIAAGLHAPGLYLAIGLGLGAIGCGLIGYRRRGAPGGARIACAAALTFGAIGVLLGALRVVLVLAAIDHLERML